MSTTLYSQRDGRNRLVLNDVCFQEQVILQFSILFYISLFDSIQIYLIQFILIVKKDNSFCVLRIWRCASQMFEILSSQLERHCESDEI